MYTYKLPNTSRVFLATRWLHSGAPILIIDMFSYTLLIYHRLTCSAMWSDSCSTCHLPRGIKWPLYSRLRSALHAIGVWFRYDLSEWFSEQRANFSFKNCWLFAPRGCCSLQTSPNEYHVVTQLQNVNLWRIRAMCIVQIHSNPHNVVYIRQAIMSESQQCGIRANQFSKIKKVWAPIVRFLLFCFVAQHLLEPVHQ